jgi:hypothetical protein
LQQRTPKVLRSVPAAPRSSFRTLVAENDFVKSAPALLPLDLLSHPVGIQVAAIALPHNHEISKRC